MKKLVSIILVLLMSMSLISCSAEGFSPELHQFIEELSGDFAEALLDAIVEKNNSQLPKNVLVDGPVAAADIPPYENDPFVVINDNHPYFEEKDLQLDVFEMYSPLDYLGRCGVAYANICPNLMPEDKREDISKVKPSGWHNHPYDFIEGKYVYNRCHLIGFQLAGENANERNLITGTRYFNVTGMLPFENMVADYVRENPNNHVLYRVTPIYEGENLVANGVLMEAYSIEDMGEGIEFCVFCYNVQPGVHIEYSTGENWIE